MKSYQLRPKPLISRPKTPRAPEYLQWLREQPCHICGTRYVVEAAHTGSGGMGLKPSDWDAIPLCEECHRTRPNSYHTLGARAWREFWDVDLAEVRERLWVRFFRSRSE